MNPATSRVILASNGSYPRNGGSSEEHILEKTLEGFQRGERTDVDVLDAENVVTRFLISEQARAGVELLTDAGARWADPVSHIARKFDGVALGEPRTLPGTEIPYRVPKIVAKIAKRLDGPRSLAEEYRFARNALGLLPTLPGRGGRLSIKPVLLGPYTLARFSESELPAYATVEARAEAFAEVLGQEIGALAAAGAALIQVDEPAILADPGDWPILRHTFARLAGARDAASQGTRRIQLALHVYGGDQSGALDRLMQLPADLLGLDLTQDAKLLDGACDAAASRAICAGLVCSRAGSLEDSATIRMQMEKLTSRANHPLYVGPSCGMERLPRELAFQKLQLLREVRDELFGQSAS